MDITTDGLKYALICVPHHAGLQEKVTEWLNINSHSIIVKEELIVSKYTKTDGHEGSLLIQKFLYK